MGRLEAIWVKRSKRGAMDPREDATLVAGRGIEGNANQGGKRQVTLISVESFRDVERELAAEIDPSWRRANMMVSGVDLRESRGRILAIGAVRLLLHGETRPCERMDEAYLGLRAALSPEWRGGAYGEILDDGSVRVGDPAEWRQE